MTRGARPRPSSVTRRRRRWRGLVSSGDWQRRRRRRPELEPQRLRAGGRARGREGGRSATTPRTAFLLRAARVSDLGGAGVQPIHDHGRQEEPDQVPAPSRGGGRGGRAGGGRGPATTRPRSHPGRGEALLRWRSGGGGRRRRRAVAAAAGGGVAPARGRRPCAPQPWRLLLSRPPPPPPPPPPPLLPDKGRFNQVGREGGREHGRGEGRSQPTPRRRPRAAPARPLQIRPAAPLPAPPPAPRSSPQVRPLPAPAAALPGAPPPPTVRGSTARARRLQGAGGGARSPPPVPPLGPEKGGWVVVLAKFPALDSWEITTAHQRLCFCSRSPFFLLPDSSLPFPPLLTPLKAKKTSKTCRRRRLLGL